MLLPDLQDACDQLKVPIDYDATKIQMCLDAAIDAASDFLDINLRSESSSSDSSQITSPSAVTAAILMICETLYDSRAAGQGEILKPWSTEWMLLHPQRRVGL